MIRQHVDAGVIDAVLRLIGGVFFAQCDGGGPEHAARAIEGLRRFADVNSDNQDCHSLCHALADAQEDALHAGNYDYRKSLKTAG